MERTEGCYGTESLNEIQRNDERSSNRINTFWSKIIQASDFGTFCRIKSNSNRNQQSKESGATRGRFSCNVRLTRTLNRVPRPSNGTRKTMPAVCARFCMFRNASSTFVQKPNFCVDENESIIQKMIRLSLVTHVSDRHAFFPWIRKYMPFVRATDRHPDDLWNAK